ncbi:MAG: peptide chain release factor 1 [bacterium]
MIHLDQHLKTIQSRFDEIEQRLGSSAVLSNPGELRKATKMHRELERIVVRSRQLEQARHHRDEAQAIMSDPDPELRAMAKSDLEKSAEEIERLEEELQLLLIPKDPNDERNIIMEIRAGTGGEEAALFAEDLFRMYSRYAEAKGWRVEILSGHQSDLRGFKEVVFGIEGEEVYSHLKFESGTHRVQRIPVTEAGGRIHTSAVTVAVLAEAEEVDIQIKPEELRVDVFRSSGPGGQSVNTTDSAVRVTHLPTGLIVSCQDEKSQHKNKAKALKVLRSRLMEMEQQRADAERAATRKAQVGTGDRSGRIRTYNFPQNRVSDHRIGLTLYRLETIMEGNIEELVEALRLNEKMEKLKNLE